MTNPYYNPTGNPASGAEGLSSLVRSEFAAIGAGFDGANSTLVRSDNPTITGLHETAIAMPALNIDCNAATIFTKTMAAISTFTVSNVPLAGVSAAFILELTNGGAFGITWWPGVKWAGAAAPALTASGVDLLGFYTIDAGATWRGLLLSKDIR
jgi:hypothetical protein